MINYKQFTFILIILCFLLTVTDSSLEKQSRKGLLSLVNIVVEEGNDVSSTAPSSFLDSMENGRIGFYNFLDKQGNNINERSVEKSRESKSFLAGLLTFLYFLMQFFKFLCSYVITFYPTLILILYLLLSSRLFRRNDYYGVNYYNNY